MKSMNKRHNLLFWICSILGIILWSYQSFNNYNSCNEIKSSFDCAFHGFERPLEIIGIALFLISISSLVFLRNCSFNLDEEE